jgi:putative resolvase
MLASIIAMDTPGSWTGRYCTYEDYLRVLGREPRERRIYAYLLVSSPAQRPDLANQRAAVEQLCVVAGKEIAEYLEDVGSGLDYKRKHFLRLMEMVDRGEVAEIVVAHKDRLVRFGFEFFEKFCADHGCRLTVMNAESLSPEEELVKDLFSIVNCFSSRLYGLGRYTPNDVAAFASGGLIHA